MEIRLLIAYLLNIVDLAATYFWVKQYGIDFELNPLGRIILSDPSLAMIVKVGFIGACFFYIYEHKENKLAKSVSWFLLFFFVTLTLYHVVGSIITMHILQQIQYT